jgi:hypothetical protein
MGIFDDNNQVDLPELARQVHDDLRGSIERNPAQSAETVRLDGRIITLRASGGRTIEIIVNGCDDFQLKYDLGNKAAGWQIQVTTEMARPNVRVSRHEMIDRVKAWRKNNTTR